MEKHNFLFKGVKEQSECGSNLEEEGKANKHTGQKLSGLAVLLLVQINNVSFLNVHRP